MRVLVCGGRDYDDVETVYRVLGDLKIDCVIHGAAKGADSIAEMYADEHGLEIDRYEAMWGMHGKHAGPIRNQRMLDDGAPDLVVAFPGGKGTADMVRRAKAAGINVVRPIDETD